MGQILSLDNLSVISVCDNLANSLERFYSDKFRARILHSTVRRSFNAQQLYLFWDAVSILNLHAMGS